MAKRGAFVCNAEPHCPQMRTSIIFLSFMIFVAMGHTKIVAVSGHVCTGGDGCWVSYFICDAPVTATGAVHVAPQTDPGAHAIQRIWYVMCHRPLGTISFDYWDTWHQMHWDKHGTGDAGLQAVILRFILAATPLSPPLNSSITQWAVRVKLGVLHYCLCFRSVRPTLQLHHALHDLCCAGLSLIDACFLHAAFGGGWGWGASALPSPVAPTVCPHRVPPLPAFPACSLPALIACHHCRPPLPATTAGPH